MRTLAVCCAIVFVMASSAGAACPLAAGDAADKPQLERPSDGSLISGFGVRLHPILLAKRMHTGVDFAGAIGDPVRSSAAGEVVTAGVEGQYGNIVVLKHGGGVETAYAHLSEIEVQEGACVERGAVIGRVGSTGFSSGPKLHFEVRLHGRLIDPVIAMADGAK
ncbi:MAG: M23 family metallopeptidase [Hyphomicrobiaceae bacterium]|nr:MAG: M23 family metallopeptidase [Hyphomicrobiaceae bacterium]